jgi:hypothetical protein
MDNPASHRPNRWAPSLAYGGRYEVRTVIVAERLTMQSHFRQVQPGAGGWREAKSVPALALPRPVAALPYVRQRNPLPRLKFLFCKNAFRRKATPFLGRKPFSDRFLREGA